MVWSTYETLYKGLMNINESSCRPWGWPRPWWWSVYPHDTPTSPFLTERRGSACMYWNYFKKYTMVLKGPGNATDLNVLQGKAYEKPCWPQYIRDQYVLKGPRYKLEMNLNPLSIYICTHCPQWLRGAKILQQTPVEKSQWSLWET